MILKVLIKTFHMTSHLQYCLTLNASLSMETKVVKVDLIISIDKLNYLSLEKISKQSEVH